MSELVTKWVGGRQGVVQLMCVGKKLINQHFIPREA